MRQNYNWVYTEVFIHCNRRYAIMAVTRCGHTNMYYFHGMEPYVNTGKFGIQDWRNHHNPVVVLRNPLDRVKSATYLAVGKFTTFSELRHQIANILNDGKSTTFENILEAHQQYLKFATSTLCDHSQPYMTNVLVGVNFRIIDFYDLDQYVPRRQDVFQSLRTDSRVEDCVTAKDVYVENVGYSLEELQHEVKLYNKFMATQERVSVEEWKEMTKGRFHQ